MDGVSGNKIIYLWNKKTILAVRFILGILFIYASIDKIIHPKAFAQIVYNYQILPDILVNILAIILPWIEIITGIFLILGIWIHGAVLIINLLFLTFIIAIISSLARGLDINCGCFNTKKGSISLFDILRDLSFFSLSIYLFFVTFLNDSLRK
ncbi:MAG: DoxX family membrane protein [Desulfobacterales bacterium]|nr:DoxX family membrane protein [Desulfobacterales bacterium]MBF0398587.1 DoxX family membrane protein [Desulfobacterales bacterium]